MTVKEMDARLEEIEIEIDDLETSADEEHFCENCEHISIAADIENFWGARCRREYPVCPSDFSPDDGYCPRRAEYKELTDRLADLREEHEKLSAVYEAAAV